jgi:ACS family hexuronate transporter-like MFS transporter
VISESFPAQRRAFVNGLVQAGASVGAVIAPPLVVWLSQAYGWRMAFVATGASGLVWLVAWLRVYGVKRQDVPHSERVPWMSLLGHRQTWGLMLGRFFSDPVWWFYLFWLPKFLVERRGFTLNEVGLLAWVPYLTADVGAILGGLLSGWLVKRGWEALRARSVCMWPFAMLMPLSLVVAYTPSNTVAMAAICVVTFAHMAWKTNIMTITNDIYPTRVLGSVAGIVAFGNGLGGTLFTWLTGWIVQHYSYDAIFVVMGFLHPLAYVVFRLLVRGPVAIPEGR